MTIDFLRRVLLNTNNVFKLLRKKIRTLTSKKMKKSRRLVKDPERYKTVLCTTWTVTGQCPYGHKCQFAHGKEELRSRQMNGVQHRATQPIWPPLPVGPPPSTCLMLSTPYALLQPTSTSIPFGPPDPIDPHAVRAAQAVARAFSCRQIAPPLPPGPPPPLLPKTPPDSVGEPVTVPPSDSQLQSLLDICEGQGESHPLRDAPTNERRTTGRTHYMFAVSSNLMSMAPRD